MEYSQKCYYVFFQKWAFYSTILIFLKYYNIVIVINTPITLNDQFEPLNAPKNRFPLFLSHFLCTKTTSLSLLALFIQKTQDFDSKVFKVHRAIHAQDSWSLTSGSLSCWTSVCLEKLSKLSYWLNVWNQLFPDMFARRLPYKYFGRRRLIRKYSGQCRLVLKFTLCMFLRDGFPGSLPTFFC